MSLQTQERVCKAFHLFPHEKGNTMSGGFENTGLSAALCAQAKQAGLLEPTPIQQAAIPAILDGRDILATAPTGTGKTAAYALPLIQKLQAARKPRCVLVLQPTRDLVLQTAKVFNACMANPIKGQPAPLPVISILGGMDKTEQADLLAGHDHTSRVIIATPGRLLDLLIAGLCILDDCAHLVLDEGDRLLSAEFLDETSTVLDHLPKPLQTLVFSATRPQDQQTLLSALLHKPQDITIDRLPTRQGPIRQAALFMDDDAKLPFVKNFFSRAPRLRSIVFVRTKSEADVLASTLKKAGLAAAPLHADLTQDKRTSTLASFASGRVYVLVATDVAARGLDIASVAQVINYDVPNQPETYLHRIGRTGRGGQKGSALTLCAPNERNNLRGIESGTNTRLRILTPEQALPTPTDKAGAPRTRTNRQS